MKIIVSPSKEMEVKINKVKTSKPVFIEKQTILYDRIKSLSIDELMNVYKISNKLALQLQLSLQDNTLTPALYLYNGLVFRQLNLEQYDDSKLAYANQHITILSSMYGALKCFDEITRYRLDQKTNLSIDLYEYWTEELNDYFKAEEFILSLASNEYEKLITHPNIINIDFVQQTEKGFKRSSAVVKKSRGMMLDYLINNKITSLNDIKKNCINDYIYSEEHSSEQCITYIKK